MATITLEVPDRLARRLQTEKKHLPQLLEAALHGRPDSSEYAFSSPPVFAEMVEFLSSRPLPAEILAFKISAPTQERLSYLLEKNREDVLSEAENAELDWYEYAHEIVTRLKAEVSKRDDTLLCERFTQSLFAISP